MRGVKKKKSMDNIILPSNELVKDYMTYDYLQAFIVGVKIALTLLPITTLLLFLRHIDRVDQQKLKKGKR